MLLSRKEIKSILSVDDITHLDVLLMHTITDDPSVLTQWFHSKLHVSLNLGKTGKSWSLANNNVFTHKNVWSDL